MSEQYVTKDGKVLTDDDLERLADEAEQGYDVTSLQGVVTPEVILDAPSAYEDAFDRVQVALAMTEQRLAELRQARAAINEEIKDLVDEQDLLGRMAKIKKKA